MPKTKLPALRQRSPGSLPHPLSGIAHVVSCLFEHHPCFIVSKQAGHRAPVESQCVKHLEKPYPVAASSVTVFLLKLFSNPSSGFFTKKCPLLSTQGHSCPLQSHSNHEPADMLKTHAIMSPVKMRCSQSDITSRPERISRTSSRPALRPVETQHDAPRHSCRLQSIRGFKNPLVASRLCAFALNLHPSTLGIDSDFVISHSSLCPSAALYKMRLFETETWTCHHVFLTNSTTISRPVPFCTLHSALST